MAKKWNPKFELHYQTHCTKEHLVDVQIKPKYDLFDVDTVIKNAFRDRLINIVVDVGGGPHGGALFYCLKGKRRVLFDYLCDEYYKMNVEHPDNIEFVQGDFKKIPFEDSSVDIVFAWDVLDHAVSSDHFKAGQKELVRILAKKGILFFSVPIRKKEGDYHFKVCTDIVLSNFGALNLLKSEVLPGRSSKIKMFKHDHLFCIYTK